MVKQLENVSDITDLENQNNSFDITEKNCFNYYYVARGLSILVFVGIIILYYCWDTKNSLVTPILVSGSVISGFSIFSTCKKRLIKIHSRPLWLEDLEGYEDKKIAEESTRMFGWLLVISSGAAAGAAAFSLPMLLEAFKTKTFFEVIALIGGLISFFKSTISYFGSIALGIVVEFYDSKGSNRTPELSSDKKVDCTVDIDFCDLEADIYEFTGTTQKVISNTITPLSCLSDDKEDEICTNRIKV